MIDFALVSHNIVSHSLMDIFSSTSYLIYIPSQKIFSRLLYLVLLFSSMGNPVLPLKISDSWSNLILSKCSKCRQNVTGIFMIHFKSKFKQSCLLFLSIMCRTYTFCVINMQFSFSCDVQVLV